jgi:CNT family concentrative nucleoside transporter
MNYSCLIKYSLANLLTILALLYTVDGLLTWIGQFWGMDPNGPHALKLELILQYILYPVSVSKTLYLFIY